ncbi:zinc-ribbon domain-containing protein [bacterium]|nr:zinc-ribbon domain-containing protein [bacterium]
MFCPNCGKEINEGSRFCLYCGHQFETHLEEEMYSHSYYKDSYKKNINTDKTFSFGETFLKGASLMLLICFIFVGLLIGKNYFAGDFLNFDRMKYQQFVENPSLIPELTQPETLNGFIDNLNDVQNFLELYLKVSDDSYEEKMETFDKYRKELLKIQNLDNTNILDANVKYQIPRTEKEFKAIKKQYDKILSKVGLTICAEDSYSKYHLIEDTKFTYKKYGKYMPEDVKEYLKLNAKYNKQVMYKDEITVKPWKLAQRIGDYEKFLNSHKEFRYIDEVQDLLFKYTFFYSFTSDRLNTTYINNKSFTRSDKKFLKKYQLSQLKDLFTHLSTSANGISESKFDELYPYKYQKSLNAITPEKGDLSDIFTIVRKNIIQLKSDDNFRYIFVSSTSEWIEYNVSKPLKKGDIILAQSENGYDVYDYKYKKTNQTIQLEENASFFIKDNQLYAYSPNHLQIKSLDSSYGNFSFRTLSVKGIKKIFPDILIINIDTFGEYSVQIDKPSGSKKYMLISTSGGDYNGYRLTGDMELGELNNIFTVSSDRAQVDWSSSTGEESYHMYFINQQVNQSETQNENE